MEDRVNRKKLLAPCDIYKDDQGIVLRMEMPGVTKDGLSVQVDGNILVIEGKRDFWEPQGEYRIREIMPGDFYHEFTLDDTIDRNSIDAKLDKGVLVVEMKLQESQKPRQIKVVAG